GAAVEADLTDGTRSVAQNAVQNLMGVETRQDLAKVIARLVRLRESPSRDRIARGDSRPELRRESRGCIAVVLFVVRGHRNWRQKPLRVKAGHFEAFVDPEDRGRMRSDKRPERGQERWREGLRGDPQAAELADQGQLSLASHLVTAPCCCCGSVCERRRPERGHGRQNTCRSQYLLSGANISLSVRISIPVHYLRQKGEKSLTRLQKLWPTIGLPRSCRGGRGWGAQVAHQRASGRRAKSCITPPRRWSSRTWSSRFGWSRRTNSPRPAGFANCCSERQTRRFPGTAA